MVVLAKKRAVIEGAGVDEELHLKYILDAESSLQATRRI
jgi:hypothetical protein